MIDVEKLQRDVSEFKVDVALLVQLLEEIVPTYEADRIELQQWRRRKADGRSVLAIANRLRTIAGAWQRLPVEVRRKIEDHRQAPVDAVLNSLVEDLEFFAEVHHERKGNPGLATDDGEIEIAPLEWFIMELATVWREARFDHSIREEGTAKSTGRFLRFVNSVAMNALDRQPTMQTLSAVIRKIKPRLAAQKAT